VLGVTKFVFLPTRTLAKTLTKTLAENLLKKNNSVEREF